MAKTLGMGMLAAFFDIHKNSDTLFEGLEISKDTASCQKWMNQYPTLFLTFKDVDGLNFDDAYGQLAAQIADLYKEHAYLLDCPIIDSDDKQIFLELKAGTAGKIHLSRSLVLLMRIRNMVKAAVMLWSMILKTAALPSSKQSTQNLLSRWNQIEEKMYAKEYEDEYDQILCYGIAFFKKRCLVQAVKND